MTISKLTRLDINTIALAAIRRQIQTSSALVDKVVSQGAPSSSIDPIAEEILALEVTESLLEQQVAADQAEARAHFVNPLKAPKLREWSIGDLYEEARN